MDLSDDAEYTDLDLSEVRAGEAPWRRRRFVRCRFEDELSAAASPDDALLDWLRAFLAHARNGHGLGGAVMTVGPDELGVDCHQRITDTAARLLGNAQRSGSARDDLSPGDLLQLVVGIALATAHTDDADEPERLLGLVLDAIPRTR